MESNWFKSEIESQACESELNRIVKFVSKPSSSINFSILKVWSYLLFSEF